MFFLCPMAFSCCQLSRVHIWDVWSKKKTQATLCYVVPYALSQLATLPLFSVQSLLMFYKWCPDILLHKAKRLGKRQSTLSPQKWKFERKIFIHRANHVASLLQILQDIKINPKFLPHLLPCHPLTRLILAPLSSSPKVRFSSSMLKGLHWLFTLHGAAAFPP